MDACPAATGHHVGARVDRSKAPRSTERCDDRSVRCALLFLALVGCSDGDAEPQLLAGSPDATRSLAFAPSGRPVAIGGTSTFGLAFLQHHDGSSWVRAELVPGFGTRALLLGGGPAPLVAVSDTTLYRLIDETARTWEGFTIPSGVSGSIFGVDADGRIYGLDLASGDGNGAVVSWKPPETRWTEVPGTRPLGLAAARFVVEPSGRVTWFVPDRGLVRAEGGAQATLVDCHDLGDCSVPFTSLSYDDRGTLTFLVCSPTMPPRFAARLPDGDTVAQERPVPSAIATCLGLGTAPDGTTVLAGVDDEGDGPLAIMPAGSATWERVAAAAHGLTYVVRDRNTVFAFGDAQLERGIYQIDID